MRLLRTAMQRRHDSGGQRASIAEYAVMIAIIAVLVSGSVLLVATLAGQ